MFITLKQYIKQKLPFVKDIYVSFVNFYKYYLQYIVIMHRQKQIYSNLHLIAKENKRKLKIIFLVNENQKWGSQNLYNKLKQSNHFEPIILLTHLYSLTRTDTDEKYYKTIEFFEKNHIDFQLAYNNKTKQFEDLRNYNPDIVVYQQPYSLSKNQNIFTISKFALAIYIPYCFVEEYKQLIKYNLLNFHYLLFRKYLSHDLIKQEYINKGYKQNNLKVVGYPKLEQYLDNKKNEKKYIIYAPHHSVKDITIKLGTFDWNGKFILEYAKKHSEFNWVFKPHPLCKHSFIKAKIFKDIEEANNYYNEWAKIGTVYDKGNYIDLFKQTKCLITDCASFLIEFLPTESPVINLKRKDSVYISDITEEIIKSYYKAYNLEELKIFLQDVLEKNIDTKEQERLNLIKNLNLVKNASDNIIEDLEKTFYKK